MYYHNSPTTKQIKQLKTAKAMKMKSHIEAMKMITANYKTILKELGELREKEFAAEELIKRFPDKSGEVKKKMTHNYKLMRNKFDKFLSDN